MLASREKTNGTPASPARRCEKPVTTPSISFNKGCLLHCKTCSAMQVTKLYTPKFENVGFQSHSTFTESVFWRYAIRHLVSSIPGLHACLLREAYCYVREKKEGLLKIENSN
jgi:hypothetical protein